LTVLKSILKGINLEGINLINTHKISSYYIFYSILCVLWFFLYNPIKNFSYTNVYNYIVASAGISYHPKLNTATHTLTGNKQDDF